MAYLRIHCKSCGNDWEIYHRDNWKADTARQCPHCFKEISQSVWHGEILPAFAAVSDAQAELLKDSTAYNTPLFTFDVMASDIKQDQKANELLFDYEKFIYE